MKAIDRNGEGWLVRWDRIPKFDTCLSNEGSCEV